MHRWEYIEINIYSFKHAMWYNVVNEADFYYTLYIMVRTEHLF